MLSKNQDYSYVNVLSGVLQGLVFWNIGCRSFEQSKELLSETLFLKGSVGGEVYDNIEWQERNRFGQVVWGERIIVNQGFSYFAIIKVNAKYEVENSLGTDLKCVKDSILKFQNIFVRKKISMKFNSSWMVFKNDILNGYTGVCINGSSLLYWAVSKH